MRGDAFGEPHIRAGGEKDLAAVAVLLLKKSENSAVIGQVRYIQRDGLGDVSLECGFAVKQRAGEAEQPVGPIAQQGQQGVNERIGFDEGAV